MEPERGLRPLEVSLGSNRSVLWTPPPWEGGVQEIVRSAGNSFFSKMGCQPSIHYSDLSLNMH